MNRILARLDELYAIGQHRAGYSPEEDAAHELAAGWLREAGLEVSSDEAGNLFGRRGEARVWSGSHLDSVPTAGRFDGALGVVAAIEAAERLPDAPLAVVAFRAEETGPMGSKRVTDLPAAFLEVHIEQGPVLAQLDESLGVVSAIAGQARGFKVFEGRADHAGTTPMDARADALLEAARFILHVRACAREGTVATVGAVEVEPNATNVVPARVTVSVDARSADAALLDALVEEIGFERQLALRSRADERRLRGRPPGRAAARLGCGARCDDARRSGRAVVDAVRALPERRDQPPPRRAVERGRHRARRRCAHRRAR